MFGLKKKGGPNQAFMHAQDCKLMKADPTTEIQWSELSAGHWVAICQCGEEHFHEPYVDSRVRLDPLDRATFRHLPHCEHRDTTDVSIVKAILRVQDREGYAWVECSSCEGGWQVPFYAAEVG